MRELRRSIRLLVLHGLSNRICTYCLAYLLRYYPIFLFRRQSSLVFPLILSKSPPAHCGRAFPSWLVEWATVTRSPFPVTLFYARLRLRARPATPRRSRSPLVGSGAAAVQLEALAVAVAPSSVNPALFDVPAAGVLTLPDVPVTTYLTSSPKDASSTMTAKILTPVVDAGTPEEARSTPETVAPPEEIVDVSADRELSVR